jgi:tRNA A-37 threonylcarbamoyl transferase component Bud32
VVNEQMVTDFNISAEQQQTLWTSQNPLQDRRPDLGAMEAGCPAGWVALLQRCWADRPEQRPTMQQRRAELLRVHVQAQPPPEPEPEPEPELEQLIEQRLAKLKASPVGKVLTEKQLRGMAEKDVKALQSVPEPEPEPAPPGPAGVLAAMEPEPEQQLGLGLVPSVAAPRRNCWMRAFNCFSVVAHKQSQPEPEPEPEPQPQPQPQLIAGRDALLLSTGAVLPGSPVPEGPAPHSTRWAALLFDPTRQADRLAALQRAADTWSPGRWVLAGQELGHGSSGVVVRCTDKRLGPVAIKFSIAREPLRLEREAALMQRVAHENICSLREHRLLEGGLFGMVLELMDGGSLQQQIAEAPDQRLPEAAVTEMSLQVLQGLYFMHEKGVIHRDVKPSNIMLCSADPGGESAAAAAAVRYKLIDLSIAAMDGDVQGAQVETIYIFHDKNRIRD